MTPNPYLGSGFLVLRGVPGGSPGGRLVGGLEKALAAPTWQKTFGLFIR